MYRIQRNISVRNCLKFNKYFYSTRTTPATKILDDSIRGTLFMDVKYRYSKLYFQTTLVWCLNYKQIRWRYSGNAFVGFQHRYFWESYTFTSFCWKWRWGQINIKLGLSSSAGNYNWGYNLFLFETFKVYLTMSLLFEESLKILPKTNNILPFNR